MIYWALAILVLGMILTVVEILMPGFGFFGISAIIAFLVSWGITILFVPYGIFVVFVEAVIIIGAIFALIEYLKRRNLKGTIILDEHLNEDVKEDYRNLVGCEGTAKTSLKPFGKAEFNNVTVDVCGDSFIEKDCKVKAVRYSDSKLYVVKI